MKQLKLFLLLTIALLLGSATSAWAQVDPSVPVKQSDGSWKFKMPAANKLLQVEYYSLLTIETEGNGKVKVLKDIATNEFTLSNKSLWWQTYPEEAIEIDSEFAGFASIPEDDALTWPKPNYDKAVLFYGFEGSSAKYIRYENNNVQTFQGDYIVQNLENDMNNGLHVFYTTGISLPDGVSAYKENNEEVPGKYYVAPGSELTLLAKPDKLNSFIQWSDESTKDTLTYTMGSQEATIAATFAPYPTLTLDKTGEGTVEVERQSELLATLSANQTTDGVWTLGDLDDGNKVNGYLVNTDQAPLYADPCIESVEIDWTQYKTIYYGSGDNTYEEINIQPLVRVKDNKTYVFKNSNDSLLWDGGISKIEIYSYRLPDNLTEFTENNAVVDGKYIVVPGTTVPVKATPGEKKYFKNWNDEDDDIHSTAFTENFTITKDTTVTAHFADQPTLTIVADPTTGGTVEVTKHPVVDVSENFVIPNPLSAVIEGEHFRITADVVYPEGWVIDTNDKITIESLNGKIISNIDLHFSSCGFASYTTSTEGTVNAIDDNVNGTVTNINATSLVLSNNYAGAMIDGITVYSSVLALPNGVMANTDGTYAVVPGTEVKVVATPAELKFVKNWNEEDDINSIKADTLAITVAKDTTVTAHFAPYPTLTIGVNDDDMGSVEVQLTNNALPEGVTEKNAQAGEYYVVPGTVVPVVATPEQLHYFKNWSREDDDISTTAVNRTFEITKDSTFTAYFAPYPVLTLAKVGVGDITFGAKTNITGYTYDGGTNAYDNQGPDKLIDGIYNNNDNKWCTEESHKVGGVWFVEFYTADTVQVNGYTLYTGGDTGSHTNRNPKNWVLKGKRNVDDGWTVIDTKSHNHSSGLPEASLAARDFLVDNPGYYKYFHFEVSNSCGIDDDTDPYSVEKMQLAELQLFYYSADNNLPEGITSTATDGVYNVAPETKVAVVATAAQDYHFDKWTDKEGDQYTTGIVTAEGVFPTTSTIALIMTADTTVQANFDMNGIALRVPAKEFVTYYSDMALGLLDNDYIAGAALYTITEVNGTTATATQLEITYPNPPLSQIAPANTPLLIYNNSDDTLEIKLIPTTTSATVSHYSKFTGVLEPTTLYGDYGFYVFNGKQFVYVRRDMTLPANKCCLKIENNSGGLVSGARAINIVFEEATAVYDLNDKSEMINDKWYDLSGRRVTKPTTKGVYIKNGKKVIIK